MQCVIVDPMNMCENPVVSLGTHYTYFVSVGHKGDEICEHASHPSAHGGGCALSDESVASATLV